MNDPSSYPENALNQQVNKRAIELPQRTRTFKANHCVKVHNIPFKLAL